MLFVVETNKSIKEIEKEFPGVASKHKFGVLGVYNLKQKMNEKGVPFERECLIFEVCNPHQAKKVLDGNMGISTMLPCRVSVYQDQDKTKIATIRPTALIMMFKETGLSAVANEVEETLFKIIQDVAGQKSATV